MGFLSRAKPINNNEGDPPAESSPQKSDSKSTGKTDVKKSPKSSESEKKKSKESKTTPADVDPEDSERKDDETPAETDETKKKKKSPGKSKLGRKHQHLKEVDSSEEEEDEEHAEKKKEGKKWRRGGKKGDVESPEGGDLGFGNPLYSLEDIPGLPRAELQDEVVIEKTASGFANPLFEEKQVIELLPSLLRFKASPI